MIIRYTIKIIVLLVLCSIFAGCNGKKQLNRRVTLWHKDKIPYGTWYAYNHLQHFFPRAETWTGKHFSSEAETADSNSLMIVIAPQVIPDEYDLNTLSGFVRKGNHLFISSFHLGETLCDSLGLELDKAAYFGGQPDSMQIAIVKSTVTDTARYTYPGFGMQDHIIKWDSATTRVLGRDADGQVNFVQVHYPEGGSILVHTAPMAFSNFFLLHKQNKSYLDQAFSFVPGNMRAVIWDDSFRTASNRKNFSAWKVIMENRSLRWALYVTIFLFLLLLISEAKRRQRIIPVAKPLPNHSLDFVKTVGRLYYQHRDNHNLAQKMIFHFREYVRSRYQLPTSEMNEAFVQRLANRSGYPKQSLDQLIYTMKMAEDFPTMDDESLLQFGRQLDNFYKNKS